MKKDRGFVGIIILVIIGLALLKYFINFDIFAAADSQHGQETIGYTGQLIRTGWSYIATPVSFVWSQIVWPLLKIFWGTFQAFLNWSDASLHGTSTDLFH